MIYISKGLPSNEVVLTLREKSLLWELSGITPYYLFSLSSDTTGQIINFVGDNIAPLSAQSRYDLFEWNTSITNQLEPEVFWTYTAFEQTSSANTITSIAYGIVETGKIFVKGPEQQPYTYFSPTGTTSLLTYSNTH